MATDTDTDAAATSRFTRLGRSSAPRRPYDRFLGIPSLYWGIATLVALTVGYVTTQSSYDLFIFDTVLLACMGAIALQVLQGTAGLVSVGSAAFLMVGAYGSVFFLRQGLVFPWDVILAGLLAGAAGLVTGIPALRLKALFLALATLAVHYVATFVFNRYEYHVPEARSQGFFVPILFQSTGLTQSVRYWAWLLLPCVVIVMLGIRCLMRERSGRALRIIREHEHIAPAIGVSVARYKVLLFGITSAVIGVEGGLTAHFLGTVTLENFSLTLGFQYVAMIIIGGVDSIAGAVVGAAVVTALPAYVPRLVNNVIGGSAGTKYGPNISLIIYGLLVIVFVVGSPDGVVGICRRVTTIGRQWTSRVRGRPRPEDHVPSQLPRVDDTIVP